MLRPVDTVLLALARYGGWARAWMVYRALVVLTAPRARRQPSTKYAMRMASTSSPPRS
jgi:hypothetical protein